MRGNNADNISKFKIQRRTELSLDTNGIMPGSSKNDGIESPQKVGASTQSLCVYIPDIDEHFESSIAGSGDDDPAP